MEGYISSKTIKTLREGKGLTQKQLGELICVSDKAVSKWENDRGLPDITLIEPLAGALGVSIAELLSGELITNKNRCGNTLRTKFYVCPICGNVINALGEGSFSCCGVKLPPLEAEEGADEHAISVLRDGDEIYVSLEHPMEREHFISFIAYVSFDRVQTVKLYPEQGAEARFLFRGKGKIYAFCNRHGMFEEKK